MTRFGRMDRAPQLESGTSIGADGNRSSRTDSKLACETRGMRISSLGRCGTTRILIEIVSKSNIMI
jgi:hypothetical protein